MISGWPILDILPVGISANTYGLSTNCYFCTAAALQKTNCSDLVDRSEYMQHDYGSIDDFMNLFRAPLQQASFFTLQEVRNFLLIQLPSHTAVALAYETGQHGHMIVAFKSMVSVGQSGQVSTPSWGNLRHIDYQEPNPQPRDGLLPPGEDHSKIRRYHIFSLGKPIDRPRRHR